MSNVPYKEWTMWHVRTPGIVLSIINECDGKPENFPPGENNKRLVPGDAGYAYSVLTRVDMENDLRNRRSRAEDTVDHS